MKFTKQLVWEDKLFQRQSPQHYEHKTKTEIEKKKNTVEQNYYTPMLG